MMQKTIVQRRPAVARIGRWLLLSLLFGAGPVLGTTVRPPAFDTLVGQADYVVHGVVTAVSAERRPGAHGGRSVTRVELEIRENVLGAVPEKVVLELWGGRIGKEALVIEGMPQFRPGDEEIVFVQANGRSVCPLVGMMHGRYSVATEPGTGRRYMVRGDGWPLRTTADVALPHRAGATDETSRAAAARAALAPAEFIRQIRSAAAQARREK